MARLWIIGLSTAALAAGCAEPVARAEALGSMPNFAEIPRHPVTGEMREASIALSGLQVEDFERPDQESKPVRLSKLLAKGPVFLVTTKDGCPCSIESQPYLNAIARAYPGVSFLGIIDASRPVASLYASSMRLPYPLAADAEKTVLKQIQAPQSVYVYQLDQTGTIARVWPGYSQSMLRELNQAAADASIADTKELDFSGAPEEMTSGCFFFQDDPVLGPNG